MGKHVKSQPAQGKGKGRGKKQEMVSQVENRTKIGKVYVETVPVTPPENEIHTLVWNIWWVKLECPVCDSCHQWHRALGKQFIFWLPMSRSVCRLNSGHAP